MVARMNPDADARPSPPDQPPVSAAPSDGPAEVAPPHRVLVVDDEQVIREILSDFLTMEGFQVLTAADGEHALTLLEAAPVNLVISDLKMPRMGGLELLARIRESHPEVVTLIMTGYGTVETAIEAMKRGAFDYVLKPFKVEEVMHTVRRGIEQQRLRAENIELKAALSLYRLAARLGDEVELGPTLELIVETVQTQTRADRTGVILVPSEHAAWSSPTAPFGLDDLTERARTALEPVIARSGRVFDWLVRGPRTEDVSSLLLVPLVSRGARVGWLVAAREGGRPFAEGARKLGTIIADRAAAAVANAQLFETLETTFRTTIEAFVTALEDKDRYTAGHSERVAEFARITAAEMGLPASEVELIHQAGRLHDIGKMTLRTEELNKPGPLTDEEYERFKAHPRYGEELLGPIPTFRDVIPAVGGHHERWDGKGYPRGIAGLQIPLMARIMAVADTYDAMTSHRAYRSALPHAKAVAELRRCKGTQFDPDIVDAFLAAIEPWREARREAGREYPR